MTIKGKPDINAFLSGGAADHAENKTPVKPEPHAAATKVKKETKEKMAPTPTSAPEARKQKLVLLPVSMLNYLKQRSVEQSINTGVRVTETELIETAIQEYRERHAK